MRVGYYQNTEYDNEEMKENPPKQIQFDRLVRDISTKFRVTRFQIKWFVLSSLYNTISDLFLQGCGPSPTRTAGCRWSRGFSCCTVCK